MATMTDASAKLAPSSFPASSATDDSSYISSLSSALVTSSSLAEVESVLNKCEAMELSGDERITPEQMHSIQITQMASLLILGEYHHARHLFRRFSSSPLSQSLPPDDVMFALWDATRSMMNRDAPAAFSAIAECAATNEPSAPLMDRIADVLRDRTVEDLARIHLRMKPALAAARLGLPSQECASGYLNRRGWTVVIVPPNDNGNGHSGAAVCLVPPARAPGEGSGGGGSVEKRLRDLTNVVAFMEQERMNA